MNMFHVKGSVVANAQGVLTIEASDDRELVIHYVSAGQIKVGSWVEVEGHLDNVWIKTDGGQVRAIRAVAEMVNISEQLVLGAADDVMATLADSDITFDD